jgi:hypothetical protein
MVALVAGVVFARDRLSPSPVSLVGGSPETALATAATKLEGSTKAGGKGFSFTVVSRSSMHARPGGPRIEIPDPNDRYKSLGFADEYYTGAMIADGIASPDGFWLQMRGGPSSPDAQPDFANPVEMAALTRDGKTWRDDGEGWYLTELPPGIGLDVATLAKLPGLLRRGAAATELGQGTVDGAPVARVSATGSIADAPGLLAIDGESFSELTAPVEYALDGDGRLVELHARVRNTNMEIHDLIVDVVVTFRYDPAPRALPEPAPTAPPEGPFPTHPAAK